MRLSTIRNVRQRIMSERRDQNFHKKQMEYHKEYADALQKEMNQTIKEDKQEEKRRK